MWSSKTGAKPKYALEHAKKDDVILLAGKGHENQEIRGVKHPFDEKVVVSRC